MHSHQSTSVKDETQDNVVGGFAGVGVGGWSLVVEREGGQGGGGGGGQIHPVLP